jgi:hypothetical protein
MNSTNIYFDVKLTNCFICRSPEIYTSGYFGKGQGYTIVDGIRCSGSEASLGECNITTNWDQGNCTLDQNIGLSCGRHFHFLIYN